jgi:diguanylate cyclase (GGDEF)-like protein
MRRRGARAKRGPRLLAIVYVANLSLVVLSAAALVWLAAEMVTATASRSALAADESIARDFVAKGLELDPATGEVTLDATGLGASSLASIAAAHGYLSVALFSADGQVLAGSPARLDHASLRADLAGALAGQTRASIFEPVYGDGSGGLPTLVEHLPVMIGDRLVTVVQVQRDATLIVADVRTSSSSLAIVAIVGATVLALLLYLVFRTAQARLTLQARELAAATRRDPLTGVLNHGAVVEQLAAEIEAARPSDRGVGIALVDIDNFSLLNDTHGHTAGDFVLTKLARELEAEGIAWSAIGRYGPDEFLVVASDDAARALEPTLQRLSRRLEADTARSVQTGDLLPVTIRAGVAHFPRHARSVSELLSAATVALGEARIAGGDSTRTAGNGMGRIALDAARSTS